MIQAGEIVHDLLIQEIDSWEYFEAPSLLMWQSDWLEISSPSYFKINFDGSVLNRDRKRQSWVYHL